MDNEDDYCFMYAATRALNMVKDHPERVNPKLIEQAEELNWYRISNTVLGKDVQKVRREQ